MKLLVVDASAALTFLLGESGHERIDQTLEAHERILVPWLFWSEVINALARRHRWPGSQVLAAVYDLEQLGLGTEPPSRTTMLAVIDAVEAHGLTAYDAEYLVLAEIADAHLLTADAHLAAAARSRAIFLGTDHRLAEEDVPYVAQSVAPGPDWPRWPGAAAYLDVLRREARADLDALRT